MIKTVALIVSLVGGWFIGLGFGNLVNAGQLSFGVGLVLTIICAFAWGGLCALAGFYIDDRVHDRN